jgi:hypothetical protein
MNKYIWTIALILSLFLSSIACVGGAISAGSSSGAQLGAAETINGLKAVVAANPGTFIMQSKDLLLMAWPQGSNYAFTIIDQSGRAQNSLNGLKLNTVNFAELIKSLEAGGWKYILPAALPEKVLTALGTYSIEAAMTAVKTMPTIWIVPVIILTPPIPQQEVIQQ